MRLGYGELTGAIVAALPGNGKGQHLAVNDHSAYCSLTKLPDVSNAVRASSSKSPKWNSWAISPQRTGTMPPEGLSATQARVSNLEVPMKSRTLSWAVRLVVVLLLALATGALAQAPT